MTEQLRVLLLQPQQPDSAQLYELVHEGISQAYPSASLQTVENLQHIYKSSSHVVLKAVSSANFVIGNVDGGNVSVTFGLEAALEEAKPIVLIAPVGRALSISEKFLTSRLVHFSLDQPNYFIKNLILSIEATVDQGNDYLSTIIRSIEFPPEYWESGSSILSYFSRVISAKYPSKKIKVRIEQEDLILRMIIVTSTGETEEVEKTLEEYGLVVAGKMQPESLLSDPIEVMRLKNKLEIANLELCQTKRLLDYTKDNSQQRIESLEVQVSKLYSLIEKGLQSGNHVFGIMSKMTEQDKPIYNLNNAKFGGGFATEGGFQVGGNFIDLSSASSLTDAAQQIQELLQQLQGQGVSTEDAKQQAATDLAKQAEANPTVMGKLVKWGQSLADTASKTTVSEAVKGVVKLALQMSGIPLP